MIPISDIIFYAFASVLVFSSAMVIVARDTVHAALFLVLAFFAAAGLWILMQSEFLALILVLVYVGAVMTLFLFVVMTMNIHPQTGRHPFLRYSPFAVMIVACMAGLVIYAVSPSHFLFSSNVVAALFENNSNTLALGRVLYTQYFYAFELAGVLLLVAIIAAITLASPVHRHRKIQLIADQIAVDPASRIRLVDKS